MLIRKDILKNTEYSQKLTGGGVKFYYFFFLEFAKLPFTMLQI